MRFPFKRQFWCGIFVAIGVVAVHATATYQYKPDEYVTINHGKSPDGAYSIAAHGEGEYGDENFHLYLIKASTGERLGALAEITDVLDTGASAFYAKWSSDCHEVSISYRVIDMKPSWFVITLRVDTPTISAVRRK